MPRSLTLILLVALALLVGACGSDDDSAGDESATTTAATTTTATQTSPSTTETLPPAPDDDATAPVVENAADVDSKPRIARPQGATPAGLVTKDLVTGSGAEAKTGDTVGVQYVGVAFSNGREFDSSWGKGEPFAFTLGNGEVIPGWEQGIVGMKVGGRREIVIPPALAYGADGNAGILPNETLVFVVDLKKIA